MNKQTNWYKDAIIYQIYPRSFKDSNGDGLGDIKGIIEKLDYLKELGVNCVWLSPIYDSPQRDNGYDIKDYRNIYPPFGNIEDVKVMIKEMHNRGIKLIMDLVINHTSNEHEWFKKALSDKNSEYRNYYIIKKGRRNGKKPPNNWTGFFGGSVWERIGESDEYYLHLFDKGQPDLNWENENLRAEVKEILKYWLDMGVDGFRCDVITLISKKQDFKSRFPMPFLTGKDAFINGPRLHEYLHELYEDVYQNYDVMTVGETVLSNTKSAVDLVNPKREELSMIFNFDHVDVDNLFGVKWLPRKFSLKRWKKTYRKWQLALEDKGWNSLFIENHDQRRSVGRFNTDEHLYPNESAKSLAATYFLMKGTPFIYQGQEIGMSNPHFKSLSDFRDVETFDIYKLVHKFAPLRLLVTRKRLFEYSRDNARTPMLWDDSEYAGFSSTTPWINPNSIKNTINVKKATDDSNSIFYFYKKLIELKKNEPLIREAKYVPLRMGDNKVFAYKRATDDAEIVVISNFSKKKIKRSFLNEYSSYTLLLSNYDKVEEQNYLRPYECRVYKKEHLC